MTWQALLSWPYRRVLMEPPTCTPKNDVLIGVPLSTGAVGRTEGAGCGWAAAAAEYAAVLAAPAEAPAAAVFEALLNGGEGGGGGGEGAGAGAGGGGGGGGRGGAGWRAGGGSNEVDAAENAVSPM